MASHIAGLESVTARLQSFEKEMVAQASNLIDEQAAETQRSLVNMLPVHSGQAMSALADPAAIKTKRDRAGNTIEASVGLVDKDVAKRAFYLLFLEKGRKRYIAGDAKLGKRFAGVDKRYATAEARKEGRDARKFRKVKRNVGPIEARQYFRVAFTLLRERMATERGINRLKAFVLDNAKNLGR